MSVCALESLHKVLIKLAVILGLPMLIKGGAIRCAVGNVDSVSRGPINNAVRGGHLEELMRCHRSL